MSGGLEAIALSEPGAGSDLGGVRLKAVRDGDTFVLDGQKTWTSAAHVAAHILLLARTDSTGTKHQGLTLFMMPTGVAGLEIRPIETMEAHTVNDLYLTGVRLQADSVVGQVGNGWKQLMRGLNVERLISCGLCGGGRGGRRRVRLRFAESGGSARCTRGLRREPDLTHPTVIATRRTLAGFDHR